jgi:hypothetical protein
MYKERKRGSIGQMKTKTARETGGTERNGHRGRGKRVILGVMETEKHKNVLKRNNKKRRYIERG